VAALLPLATLVAGAATGTLGANPAEVLIRSTGDWTLRLLCLTLAVTPLRQFTGWHALARLRRMLGLFCFFYGLLHFLCFAWLDMGLDPEAILRDIAKRPFILVGSTALLLMLPLAATSFNRRHFFQPSHPLAGCGALAAHAPARVCRGSVGAAALLLDAQWQERLR